LTTEKTPMRVALFSRLLRNAAWLAAFSVAAIALAGVFTAGLYSPIFFSGWILAALLIFLSLFGMRRRVLEIAPGGGAAWMQAHIYGGGLAVVVFFLHAGIPEGVMESVLWGFFIITAASGAFGLFLCRSIPPRIRARGGEINAAFIPKRRREIAVCAEALCADAMARSDRQSLAGFYARQLRPFFAARRNLLRHLVLSAAPLQLLLREADDICGVLDADGAKIAAELRDLIVQKDALDFQSAMNFALRGWLFIHLPATGALLLLSVAHIASAYGFILGGR
jgi:hypothetical protein